MFQAIPITGGSTATATATCTTMSAVQVLPSCNPVAPPIWRSVDCSRCPVAASAGTMLTMKAANTARPMAYAIVDAGRPGSIQYGRLPGPVMPTICRNATFAISSPSHRCKRGERERLHEQLRDDAPAARAQRRAHRDLGLARCRSGVDQ